MIIVGILLVVLLGYSIINKIDMGKTPLEKFGFSLLIGMGAVTIAMFIFDILHIPIRLYTLYPFMLGGVILLQWRTIKKFRFAKPVDFNLNLPGRIGTILKIARQHLLWTFFILLILFIATGSVVKSLYWPTFAYDNIAGYDLMGKVIAAEGKINNSLFEIDGKPIDGSAKRLTYPILVSGSFAYAYLHNLKTSKIMTSLFFIFFIISFYALLKNYTERINAAIGTFFMVITPEFLAFTSLSTTNIPFAIYASLAMITLFLWIISGKREDLIVAAIFAGLTVWTRSEGIIFIITGVIAILVSGGKERRWKNLLLYFCIGLAPLLAWNIYMAVSFNASQSVFYLYPYWDFAKIKTMLMWIRRLIFAGNYFGITFYIVFIAFVLNIKQILHDRTTKFLLMTVLSWGLFTLLYYQIDYSKLDPLDLVMTTSYRRGLFCFVPLIWYYVFSNHSVAGFSRKIFSDFL